MATDPSNSSSSTPTLPSGRRRKGQIIKLRFAGTKIWEITISGVNLWRLYDLIMQHRMCWIMKSDRGFDASGGKEPLIRGIDIKEIEREQ